MIGHGLVNFNPKNFSELVLWLDAANPSNDGTQPADNTAFGTWVDLSGNGNTASQSNVLYKPTFRTNRQNGLPGIVFPDNNNGMTMSMVQSTTLDCTAGLTLYVVAMMSIIDFGVLFSKVPSGATGWYAGQWLNNGGAIFVSSHGQADAAITPSTSTAYLWSYNLSSTNLSMYQNAVSIYSNNADWRPVARNGSAYIGSYINVSNYWSGDIYEILLFNNSHSAGKMSIVHEYLRTKWHLYYT